MLTRTHSHSGKTDKTPFSGNGFHGFSRRLVCKALGSLQYGAIELQEGGHHWSFGDPADLEHRVVVQVAHPRFYSRLLFGGTVGAGESYADGDWQCSDLTLVVRLMAANREVLQGLDGAVSRWFKQGIERIVHLFNANTRGGSRKNIAAHYDLSNEFFKLWLDSRMMYSSAVFADNQDSLEVASENKLRRLCEQLDLQAGEHLLEIGSGWGGLAIFAASNYDVRVTTTTISQAQYDETRLRVQMAGLDDRVEVLLQDYRDLHGCFDKVVSVEMVEAVGDNFVDGYFRKVESLLAPGGRFVMQAITIADQNYASALREVDFIKKHIFPGSFIPSITRLVQAATHTHALKMTHLNDIGLDYAKTLRCWSENFARVAESLESLGFDRRFQRLWQFYFSYCEGGFLERSISDVQVTFSAEPIPLQL